MFLTMKQRMKINSNKMSSTNNSVTKSVLREINEKLYLQVYGW